MKNTITAMLVCMIALLGSFSSKMINSPILTPKPDSASATIKQENDFLIESKSDPYAYVFTKDGDYKFIIIEVYTPPFEYLNFCLDGSAADLRFLDQRIVCPEVRNEFRCITSIQQNLASNEYVVKGIKAGAKIMAWPSNPSMVLIRAGIHCRNNKFDCKLYGPQAEWENNDGYKFKVMVLKNVH